MMILCDRGGCNSVAPFIKTIVILPVHFAIGLSAAQEESCKVAAAHLRIQNHSNTDKTIEINSPVISGK